MTGEVERLEAWQLPAYLDWLEKAGVTEVSWNREQLTLTAARQRAVAVNPTSTVAADGAVLYVAEPDHSADDTPRPAPIQLRQAKGKGQSAP